jgi:hypothetical protein
MSSIRLDQGLYRTESVILRTEKSAQGQRREAQPEAAGGALRSRKRSDTVPVPLDTPHALINQERLSGAEVRNSGVRLLSANGVLPDSYVVVGLSLHGPQDPDEETTALPQTRLDTRV